ncbi:MAG: AIR synthase family protein [Clostridia bacterium]|nr:AIR synthase family protein [Clostridia bacterium]
MEVGKVPNDILKSLILEKIKYTRKEVLLRPKIGEDCCAVDFGEYACVLSTDPITGAVNEIGRLAVHISCNDIASCGVEPIGLLVTILAPPDTTEKDLDTVMTQICDTASLLNVDILGGHTEITTAVNRFVITSTAIGRAPNGKIISTAGAKPGDDIIITKAAGIEGTAIIAHDKEDLLIKNFDNRMIDKAKGYVNSISVIKEGIIAGDFGASSMHDVTEGGILGAVWEVGEASHVGVVIDKDKIPVTEETKIICEYFEIDPLKLISSGCMLITAKNGEELVQKLNSNGVDAAIIGKVTDTRDKLLVSKTGTTEILQPESDELYKVI